MGVRLGAANKKQKYFQTHNLGGVQTKINEKTKNKTAFYETQNRVRRSGDRAS